MAIVNKKRQLSNLMVVFSSSHHPKIKDSQNGWVPMDQHMYLYMYIYTHSVRILRGRYTKFKREVAIKKHPSILALSTMRKESARPLGGRPLRAA